MGRLEGAVGGWDRVRDAEGGGGEPGGDDIIMSYLLLECFWFFQPAELKFSANYFTVFSVWITQAAVRVGPCAAEAQPTSVGTGNQRRRFALDRGRKRL